MRLQTVVVIDGQLSMMSFTIAWLEQEILIYERNGFAIHLRPRPDLAELDKFKQHLEELNGPHVGKFLSGTHLSIYWLLVNHPDPLPNLINVGSILEALQV